MTAITHHHLTCIGALAIVMATLNPAQAAMKASAVPAPACALSAAGIDQSLSRTRLQLTQGKTLTVVAIGSSSTTGAGASSPAASYPSRLEAFLKARFPNVAIRVINRGVNGEEEADMIARFDRDVIAEKPDLVLWQVGANAVMRSRPLAVEEKLIRNGIERLKATGADVVLVDVQYTTAILAKATAVPMIDLISAQAREQEIGVFRRFDLMKDWRVNQKLAFASFTTADGLHMNDWGYDCFARNLASAIIDSAAPPAMASAPTAVAE